MRITAKADYAVRAAAELAAAGKAHLTADRIAQGQAIPRPFLVSILADLRRAGIVESRRGPDGGHRLARPAAELTVADVVRAIDGPLAGVAGQPPEAAAASGPAELLPAVWVATRSAVRDVLEHVTLADLAEHRLPSVVEERLHAPGAWTRR